MATAIEDGTVAVPDHMERREFASLLQRKVTEFIERGDFDLTSKAHLAAAALGLRATDVIDKRARVRAPIDAAERARYIISIVNPPIAQRLEDGVTVEGDFEELK